MQRIYFFDRTVTFSRSNSRTLNNTRHDVCNKNLSQMDGHKLSASEWTDFHGTSQLISPLSQKITSATCPKIILSNSQLHNLFLYGPVNTTILRMSYASISIPFHEVLLLQFLSIFHPICATELIILDKLLQQYTAGLNTHVFNTFHSVSRIFGITDLSADLYNAVTDKF